LKIVYQAPFFVKVFVVCFVEERKVMFNFLKGGLLCVEN